MKLRIALFVCLFTCSFLWGQATGSPNDSSSQPSPSQQSSSQQSSSMSGMNMSGHDMSNMHTSDAPLGTDKDDNGASAGAMHSMEGHMDMGPHMKMTALRPPKPGDAARAQQIVDQARTSAEKYLDYHTALNDGFHIFAPNVPQKVYHFTSSRNAVAAQFHFDASRPTSLLYEKNGSDYKLIGVMYTAPKILTEDQLDERVPLSVAQWHEHVNFCRAPLGKIRESFGPNPQFGARGSISTKEACDAAGGTFIPLVFNWMVHVYPFEKDPASIWSVERQHGDAD
jgi:hypothetical protein